jgi:kinesin family protein 2/24
MVLIDRAASFRRTAPTLKNGASSRSHGICRIRIKNPSTGSEGLLYLVDLAGSEAARDVAEHGADRMRETREINMSLSVLKDCIRGKAMSDALRFSGGQKSQEKKPHVPFRQSALTKVLKHVFDPAGSQPCKTVVIACINPSLGDVGPSKNTLRYAEMLRVFVPKTDDVKPRPATNGDAAPVLEARSLRDTGRPSSRDLVTSGAVPFKERIRPGMVIGWTDPDGRGLVLGLSDNDPKLAVVLCPVVSVHGIAPDALGNVANSKSGGTGAKEVRASGGAQYLCALVTPGPMANTYELNIWQQVVIDVDMMNREVVLEYDAGTRYYYISD